VLDAFQRYQEVSCPVRSMAQLSTGRNTHSGRG